VVAESMYSGKVKEMGLVLLQKDAYVAENKDGGFGVLADFDRLTELEVTKLQIKLARAIVVFMEILHLLIARNRDLLLTAMRQRKRGEAMSTASGGYRNRAFSAGRSTPDDSSRRGHGRGLSTASGLSAGYMSAGEMDASHRHADDASGSNLSAVAARDKTEKNIAVHSELQRTFIGMAKTLYNPLAAILGDETPRWLKESCKDNYFSSSIYHRPEIEIRMEEEIYFYSDNNRISSDSDRGENYEPPFQVMSIDSSGNSMGGFDSVNGSQSGSNRGARGPGRRGIAKQSQRTMSGLSGDSVFHV